MSRMAEYEKAYEPLGDNELQWASSIHVIDIASGAGTMQVSRIQGYLPGRIVYFLLNAHLSMRPIYFCRHGKSEDNVAGKIGGDSQLSPAGVQFSEKLRLFLESLPASERPAAIWTSTLKRTVQTAAPLHGWPRVQWRALDEIDAGACDGALPSPSSPPPAFQFTRQQRQRPHHIVITSNACNPTRTPRRDDVR